MYRPEVVGEGLIFLTCDSTTSLRRPFLRHWLVLALICALVTFSLTLFIATEEAHAKEGAPVGGGGDGSGGGKESSGGGGSGGGGDLSGASGGLLNDGSGGAGGGGGDEKQKEGPLSGSPGGETNDPKPALADSEPVKTNDPKPALADSEPVREKASGDLLGGASGQTSEPNLSSSDSLLKTTSSPTSDPDAALAPTTIEGTKDTLEGITQPLSSTSEPLSSASETIQPLVAGAEEAIPTPATLTTATKPLLDEAEKISTPSAPAALVDEAPQVIGSALEEATETTIAPLTEPSSELLTTTTGPITDQLGETTQQPLPLLDEGGALPAPVRETLDPVLGNNTTEPLLNTAQPLLGDAPLLGPLTPAGPAPYQEAPVSSGSLPALNSPTPAPELGTPPELGAAALEPTAFAPATAPAVAPTAATPTFFEPFAQGEVLPVPSSSVLGVVEPAESPALAPSVAAPNNSVAAAGAPAEATTEAAAPSLGLATIAANKEVSTILSTDILGAALTSWAKSIFEDTITAPPFSPGDALPIAGSAFGGLAGSASGFGLGLFGALALLLCLTRINTLLRAARETFSASSYLQLAIERPG